MCKFCSEATFISVSYCAAVMWSMSMLSSEHKVVHTNWYNYLWNMPTNYMMIHFKVDKQLVANTSTWRYYGQTDLIFKLIATGWHENLSPSFCTPPEAVATILIISQLPLPTIQFPLSLPTPMTAKMHKMKTSRWQIGRWWCMTKSSRTW